MLLHVEEIEDFYGHINKTIADSPKKNLFLIQGAITPKLGNMHNGMVVLNDLG